MHTFQNMFRLRVLATVLTDTPRTSNYVDANTGYYPMAGVLKIMSIFKIHEGQCLFAAFLEEMLVVVNGLFMTSN